MGSACEEVGGVAAAEATQEVSADPMTDADQLDTSVQYDTQRLADALTALRTHAPELLVSFRRKHAEVVHQIEQRWGAALDAYDLLVITAQNALRVADEYTYPDAVTHQDYQYEALQKLAARVCQIAKEVRVLMAAGYAPAASTRWRSAHEVHVVAVLLERHDATLAKRYLLYNVVERSKLANDTEMVYKQAGIPLPPEHAAAIAEVRQEREKLKQEYEKEFFEKPQGWAASLVRDTSIRGLEKAAGLSDRRSAYNIASGSIHPNTAGTFAYAVPVDGGMAVALGPSSEGLLEPGISTVVAVVGTFKAFLRYAMSAADRLGISTTSHGQDLMPSVLDSLLEDVTAAFQTA